MGIISQKGKWIWFYTLDSGEKGKSKFSTYESAMSAIKEESTSGKYELVQVLSSGFKKVTSLTI